MSSVIQFRDEPLSWRDLGIDTRGRFSGQVKTLCPKCSHTRRHKRDLCLSVNLDKEVFNCHHCGWSGGLGRGEKTQSVPPPERWPKEYTKPTPILTIDQKSEQWMRSILRGRGLSDQTINEAKVTTSRVKFDDEILDTIAFPYFRDGEIVNYKYYRPDPVDGKKCKMVYNAERLWYGLDWCRDADQIIITEGEIDALSFREAGYQAVLSVPDGAPNPNSKDYTKKFEYYDEASPLFNEAAIVIIATDSDAPGEFLAAELSRRIGKNKCFRMSFPKGCKDGNDVLVKYGVEELQRCVQDADPWPVEGVVQAKSLASKIMMIKSGNYLQGVTTGYPSLDKLFRPALGQMTVIVGVPQHGKTQFVDSLMLQLCKLHGWGFGVFSPENYPPELHLTHLIQRLYKRKITDISDEEIDKAIIWLNRNVHIIAPDEPTLTSILDRASILVQRSGIRALTIDPWTEVQEEGENTQKFIKQGLTKIGQAKRNHDMHIFVTVHPRKLQEERDIDGMVKTSKPSGYDIADSAHFVNKADNVISIWRDVDREGAPIEVSVIKARFRERGQRGTMFMSYDPVSQALSDGGLAP